MTIRSWPDFVRAYDGIADMRQRVKASVDYIASCRILPIVQYDDFKVIGLNSTGATVSLMRETKVVQTVGISSHLLGAVDESEFCREMLDGILEQEDDDVRKIILE